MKTAAVLGIFTLLTLTSSAQDFKAGDYRGGVEALYQHIALNVKYTKEAEELKKSGIAYAAFLVDESGGIDSAWMVKAFDPSTSKNILKSINGMEGFKPSTAKGKAVPAIYAFNVIYSHPADPKEDLMVDLMLYEPLRKEYMYINPMEPVRLSSKQIPPQFRVKTGSTPKK